MPWILPHFYFMNKIFQSLIQSDYGEGKHKNFEAVILEGWNLVHWYRDNFNRSWHRSLTIVEKQATGPGSIIQSDFKANGHGNYEVVVPLYAADGRIELWHYFLDNSRTDAEWQPLMALRCRAATSSTWTRFEAGVDKGRDPNDK